MIVDWIIYLLGNVLDDAHFPQMPTNFNIWFWFNFWRSIQVQNALINFIESYPKLRWLTWIIHLTKLKQRIKKLGNKKCRQKVLQIKMLKVIQKNYDLIKYKCQIFILLWINAWRIRTFSHEILQWRHFYRQKGAAEASNATIRLSARPIHDICLYIIIIIWQI